MRSLTARKKSKNGTHRLPWGSFFVCHNNFFTKQCGDWMDETKCVFWEIVEGTKSARIVYETDSVIAMIDPRQAIPGHILVIPKEHFQDIYALSEEAGYEIMKAIILLSQSCVRPLWPNDCVALPPRIPDSTRSRALSSATMTRPRLHSDFFNGLLGLQFHD